MYLDNQGDCIQLTGTGSRESEDKGLLVMKTGQQKLLNSYNDCEINWRNCVHMKMQR